MTDLMNHKSFLYFMDIKMNHLNNYSERIYIYRERESEFSSLKMLCMCG